MSGAIKTSHSELINGTNADSNHDKVMVLFSDGEPNSGTVQDTRDAADAAKADDVRIITIAYGDGANETFMEDIASSSADAYVADQDDLNQIFSNIGEDIETCEGSSLAQLSEQFEDGQLLDGDTSDDPASPFRGDDTQYIGFEWNVSKDVGNEIQTDSAAFDMKFYAGQHRHNEDPSNPFPLATTS